MVRCRRLWTRTKFDEDTARVLVDTLADLVSPPLGALATKDDLARLEERFQLRIDIKVTELRSELRTEIRAAKGETIRWVLGAAIGQVIAVIGLVGAVLALTR